MMENRFALTVLLVLQRDDARAVLVEALRDNDFTVQCADTAAECMPLVRQVSPALIVMDRVLPDGDGWDLVRVLKTLSSTRDVPVIAVTDANSRSHMERAFLVGCDAFLVKPFDATALLGQIRQLLRAASAARIVS
jgi:DNA-binding response OmpR family regulator